MGFRRVAVIMAGGSGTRFWPVSTPVRPKQFLTLAHPTKTLLQQAHDRATAVAGNDTYIATTGALRESTLRAMPGVPEKNVFGEPLKRNTLGAIVWATASLAAALESSGEALSIAILTADHAIEPAEAFAETVRQAMEVSEATDSLVTIGIRPTRPATEYGYVKLGAEEGGSWRVDRFTEKPDLAKAEAFLDSGDHLWNSGMFFWTYDAFLRQLLAADKKSAEICEEIKQCLVGGDEQGAERAFEGLENTSIDYALLEKAPNVRAVEAKFEWDDLGSWDALARSMARDGSQNVSHGSVRLLDSAGCVAYNDSASSRISLVGVEDVVVVVTDDEVLVCKKESAQKVRDLAD